jgi:hypothetical protein
MLLAVLSLSASGASAQTRRGEPRITYTSPNALYAFAPDQPLVCVPYQVERGHQTMGIQRMYHYQLPLTRQLGLLGFTADSAIRYLSVSMDVNPGPGGWRYFATIHFKRNGEVEIGRTAAQSLQPDSLSNPLVYGITQRDATQALAMARHLAARCR